MSSTWVVVQVIVYIFQEHHIQLFVLVECKAARSESFDRIIRYEAATSGQSGGLIAPSPGLAMLDRRRVVPDVAARFPGGKVPAPMLGLPEAPLLLAGFAAFTFMLFLVDPRNVPVSGEVL